jgi:translocation and assembly module TamB
MTRRSQVALFLLAVPAVLIITAIIAGVIVVRSGWFHDKVRDRIVSEVEKASGGHAEIGEFKFDWHTMTAEVRPFVLHGKERPGEPVFFRAGSVQVGLKIVSALKKEVDLASGIVENPELHIIVYPDGTTNLPSPAKVRKGNFVENILKLKVRHYELRHGVVAFKQERVPIDIRGDNLSASLDYDTAGALYRGHVSSRQLHVETTKILPLIGDFDTDLTLDKDRLQLSHSTMQWKDSWVEASGEIRDWSAPRGAFQVRSNIALAELGGVLRLPLERRGQVAFTGTADVAFAPKFSYLIKGHATGRGLAYRWQDVEAAGITLNADGEVTPAGVSVSRFTAAGLGGTFTGRATLPDFKGFHIEGQASGLALAELSRFETRKALPWSGTASGPVELSGEFANRAVRNLTLKANLEIAAAQGGIPLQGSVDVVYDQRSRIIQLGNSHLSTPGTKLDISGTLGRQLTVKGQATDLSELLPALRLVDANAPDELPVKLQNGVATLDALVTGPLDSPRIAGHVTATSFVVEKQHFDRVAADVDLSQSMLTARNITLDQGALHITGAGTAGLANWRAVDASTISGSLNVRGADVKTLLADAGVKQDTTGTASAAIQVRGTFGAPVADIQLDVNRPAAFGEQLDGLHATVHYAGGSFDVVSGDARLGQARVSFAGAYTRTTPDWKNGRLRFTASSTGLRLEQIQRLKAYASGLTGMLAAKATGAAEIRNGDFDLTTLDSEVNAQNVALDGSAIGSATASARTRANTLHVRASGNMRGSKFSGAGEWRLEGDYPGRGEIQFSPITFAALQAVAAAAGENRELPFQGVVEGRAVISGPLKKPAELSADITLPRIEITPNPSQRPVGNRNQDLVLRNTAPVTLTGTLKAVSIRNASFTAKDTKIDVSGRVAFDSKSPWDLKVNGGINLAILQLFQSDIVAQGNAVVNASVTGSLRDPQVNGRLELHGASLYLGDIPVGVDNANGLIAFDRSRANIEKLTAEVGGGKVAFGGFVGFNAGTLLYRVQASADQVRIRYPEGVSTTLTAALDLTGSSQNSLVSGTITIVRAGFTPKADVGSLLAATAKPISAPVAPNEYLRNIQLDVRIESGPSLQFQTSLTRDLEAEVDLRLRGNAARPTLIGEVSVNEGEVNVFGNKYTINRGEIRFTNPTRIEPVFDVDLETKARGITVNISFTGTLNRINLTYRSDPPLQSSEIVALLAVGRDPTTSAGLASGQVAQNSFLESGSGVIGQALSTPVTSRLQRFFGVTRLKIDPQLTGVENIPQARLTLEQQVSRDITLTYITNLTRTQEQIVRIQWDISRQWSAIAVREENGVFGVDFQYRKRFK